MLFYYAIIMLDIERTLCKHYSAGWLRSQLCIDEVKDE